MARNIFTDSLSDAELMNSLGMQQDNAPLTPEELQALSQEQETIAESPVVQSANPVTPKKTPRISSESQNPYPNIPGVPDIDKLMAGLPKDSDMVEQETTQIPPTPRSRMESLLEEYNKLSREGMDEVKSARERDRMLKVGGAIGDALATYLNARSQMNVKTPGVQVQQGAGLGKIADMFATAPEMASDLAARREALLAQYTALAKGEESAASRALRERQIAAYEEQTKAQARKAEKKEQPLSFEEKEQIKADVKEQKQIAKENREVKRKLEPAINSVEEQLTNVNNALKLFIDEKTGKIRSGLTDPVRQYIAPYTEEGQKVQNALNKLSLSEMIKMFQGMSKAVDSDAERAFFQAAQASLDKYETVNVGVLQEIKEKLESLKRKSEAKLQEIKGVKKEKSDQQSELGSKNVIVRRDPKSGRRVEYDAETKKPIRFLD